MTWIDLVLTIVVGLVILIIGILIGRKLGLDNFRRKLK